MVWFNYTLTFTKGFKIKCFLFACQGASGSNAYIASQGPLPNTVNDFWRMVVECEVQVIVMACNEQVSRVVFCYWVPIKSLPETQHRFMGKGDQAEVVGLWYLSKYLLTTGQQDAGSSPIKSWAHSFFLFLAKLGAEVAAKVPAQESSFIDG